MYYILLYILLYIMYYVLILALYKGPIFFGRIPIVTFIFYNIVFNHKGNISITRNPLGEF
jgi:hypothetical protein